MFDNPDVFAWYVVRKGNFSNTRSGDFVYCSCSSLSTMSYVSPGYRVGPPLLLGSSFHRTSSIGGLDPELPRRHPFVSPTPRLPKTSLRPRPLHTISEPLSHHPHPLTLDSNIDLPIQFSSKTTTAYGDFSVALFKSEETRTLDEDHGGLRQT